MLPIVVVGAGAAGIVAAIFAARGGRRVLLLERTRDGGRKILISGGGRCNILPSALAPQRFITDSSPNLLRRLLTSWPLEDQRRFFEVDAGIPLTLEAEGKLFPVSNSARHVRDALFALAGHAGVTVRFESLVTALQPLTTPDGDGGWIVRLATADPVHASRVILATGGLSVPKTGSDGTGLELARRLGHTINPTYPALTPLVASPPRHAGLAGVSLHAAVRAGEAQSAGGFLFTHRGYSGPAVLDISHIATRARGADAHPPMVVRWGRFDRSQWDAALQGPSRLVLTVVREQLPVRLATVLLDEAGIAPETRTSELRRELRLALLERLTRYELPWTADEGYAKAEVTGGGVALAEVKPSTLESRLAPGLFLCGEMLDAFGPIGGYNFAWAWATGRLAGLGAA